MDQNELIKKYPVKANLENYDESALTFDFAEAEQLITGFSGGKINAAYEAVDRHATTWRKNKIALYWVSDKGVREKYTFLELAMQSSRFANVLTKHGVVKGDRVFVFLPRIPQLYISMIGIAKTGAISGPLFSAFGPGAVKDRLFDSDAKVLVTTSQLRRDVMEKVISELPKLETIIIIGDEVMERGVSYESEMASAGDEFKIVAMERTDPLIMHYTSGTTGKPKGVEHVHGAILGHAITARQVLDLRDDDIYWCSADPGWITGTSYGIFGPWILGISQVVVDGRFDAEIWYSIIEDHKVTVWYTAPTALRLLMNVGDEVVRKHNLKSLRHICSVGEPLNPEVIRWGMKVYGLPIHDTWWQTETGMMMIVNYPCLNMKVGSMGKPVLGTGAAVIDENGVPLPFMQSGTLALRPGWPAMMKEIWKNPEKYESYFKNGWYISGDNAYMDEDGYFWFVGRADDVIKTSGHRVGPFEVESALLEHKAVAEAGVIGKPDVERGEIIKAFISLRPGYEPSDELKEDIKTFIKQNLAFHAYPREIEFKDNLPKTRSGKIMRRVLKAWELGLPAGDLSTLED